MKNKKDSIIRASTILIIFIIYVSVFVIPWIYGIQRIALKLIGKG